MTAFFLVIAGFLAAIAGRVCRWMLALWQFRQESLLCEGEVIAVEQKIHHDSDGAHIEYLSTFGFRALGRTVTGTTLRGRPLDLVSRIPVRYRPGREDEALVWLAPHHWMFYPAFAVALLSGLGVLIGLHEQIYWPAVAPYAAVVFCMAFAPSIDVADLL